ncbi:MAG: xylulokinase [Ignavibacteriaceae bacterium]
MLSLGYDIGSSSIKASILNIESGELVTSGYLPKEEMQINSPAPGFAEQEPETWWKYLVYLTKTLLSNKNIKPDEIKCIGISYQMHGLVIVDKNKKVIRPAIIWCDSRAVEIGDNAFNEIGKQNCLSSLLNSPGNFTASKLMWIRQNEPENFNNIYKFMLPGDYIAMKLTGEISTTISGLSEGIFWDFNKKSISNDILNYFGFNVDFFPKVNPSFSEQGKLSKTASEELGLNENILVSYRAGDQPNNAFSLNVLNPGEIAATAGTSGVVYGVIENNNFDNLSRVNQFAHVNYSKEINRLGVLLCINGTGILNSWLRKNVGCNLTYEEMNIFAADIPVGSEGVFILPFGNGAERVLQNKNIGCQIYGLDFIRHSKSHLLRAAQEGIAFSFKYGIDIMKEMGMNIQVIRAGKANMFLSKIFAHTLSNISQSAIELYDTDGAQGAARGAALGAGYYKSFKEAFKSLIKVGEILPESKNDDIYNAAYYQWVTKLTSLL